ncbi:thioredoxin reductase 1 domain protein, partial [Chlamydia psittaci 06-1683]
NLYSRSICCRGCSG